MLNFTENSRQDGLLAHSTTASVRLAFTQNPVTRLAITGIQGPAGAAGADGDVVGPASSTDNAVARWDGALGGTLQNSGVIVDDFDNDGQLDILTSNVHSCEPMQLFRRDSRGMFVDRDGRIRSTTRVRTIAQKRVKGKAKS